MHRKNREKANILDLFRQTFLFNIFQKIIGIIVEKKFIDQTIKKEKYEKSWGTMNLLKKALLTLLMKYENAMEDELTKSEDQQNGITRRLGDMMDLVNIVLTTLTKDRLNIPNNQQIEFRKGFRVVTTPYTQEFLTDAAVFLANMDIPQKPEDWN